MSAIDPTVAAVLDRPVAGRDESDDEDALIAALEEDDNHALSAFREQRLQQLYAEVARAKQMRGAGNGTYSEMKDEKDVMDLTTSAKYAVVHFFKGDFGRCGVMDQHLETLAPKHFDTRFLKINVENAPFLVTKLKVQVLPCVIAFVDGISVDRIIGFEGLGHGDNFTTKDLEARLLHCGVLVRPKITEEEQPQLRSARGKQAKNDSEDDDDWD